MMVAIMCAICVLKGTRHRGEDLHLQRNVQVRTQNPCFLTGENSYLQRNVQVRI